MDTLIFLRSYGDFIVALYCLSNSNKKIRLIASSHLQEIYLSLSPFLKSSHFSIEFVDIGVRYQLLAAFTNRHLFSIQSIKELIGLRKVLNKNTSDEVNDKGFLLEQKKRLSVINLFVKDKLKCIHQNGNIYTSYATFCELTDFRERTFIESHKTRHVIIFPDSRLKRKAFSDEFIEQLKTKFSLIDIDCSVAFFRKKIKHDKKQFHVYHNFYELIELIHKASFVICADSLPAHLAQLLNIPHVIIYSKYINEEWITPYAKTNSTAFTINEILNSDFGKISGISLLK